MDKSGYTDDEEKLAWKLTESPTGEQSQVRTPCKGSSYVFNRKQGDQTRFKPKPNGWTRRMKRRSIRTYQCHFLIPNSAKSVIKHSHSLAHRDHRTDKNKKRNANMQYERPRTRVGVLQKLVQLPLPHRFDVARVDE
jgi:hypothetical protein